MTEAKKYDNSNDALAKAYSSYDIELRKKRLKTALLISIILVPLFGVLDLVIYPNVAMYLISARFVCSLLIASMLFVLVKAKNPNTKIIGFLWAAALFATIDIMIFVTEGPSSPYYAGLNLVIVVLSVVLPWTFVETIMVCIMMIILYSLAFTFHLFTYSPSYDLSLLINNLFFLISTSVICVTASYFNSELRFKEFCLNYELEEKNEKLRVMDQMKTQFFANISHEFRTPLTLILGPIHDLLHNSRNKLPNRVNDVLNTIQQNGLRLLKLVNDLLDVIRLQEGKTNLHMRKLEINSFIAGLADSMIHLADIQKVNLKKNISHEEKYIYADEDAMEKIVLNLLNNAIKFTPAGGNIMISTRFENKNAIIEVEDTGIGIKPADLSYIFERFRQVDSSATRQYQGTGLGLALVKELTELQNGKVAVKSQFEKGTKFTLTFVLFSEIKNSRSRIKALIEESERELDFNDVDEANLIKLHKNAQRSGGLKSPLKESDVDYENNVISGLTTILVIDDEHDMRKYIVDLIEEEAKYNVLQAFDGKMGLEMTKKFQPDLVILDLMLPKIDGLELCRKIKEDEELRMTKVILLTARIDEDSKISALKNGADDFITKPFSATEVRSRIENLIENNKLEKDLKERNNDLKKTVNELKLTQSQLIQSEKINALGSLSAGLLHEINNPLNYTMTALHLVKSDSVIKKDKDLNEIVGDIEEGMTRIKTIVSDLRAFAYPEESSKQAKFLISDAVTSAIRFTAHEAIDVKIVNEIDKNLGAFGSNSHIVQILVNLITNACKAIKKSHNEKGVIKIYAQQKNDRIVVFVEDNGTGMDEKTLTRIFDPFFTTNNVGEGVGLGLSICHTIMKNHGGSLNAESEVGKGSRFFFDLAG